MANLTTPSHLGGLQGRTLQTYLDQILNAVRESQAGFEAYRTSTQSINSGADTVIQATVELFDSNSFYDTSTYKFTPLIAGYYHVYFRPAITGLGDGKKVIAKAKKNGTVFAESTATGSVAGAQVTAAGMGTVYLNGSTDYVEWTVQHNHGSALNLVGSQEASGIGAFLVKAG